MVILNIANPGCQATAEALVAKTATCWASICSKVLMVGETTSAGTEPALVMHQVDGLNLKASWQVILQQR